MEEDCARRKMYQIQCNLPVERSKKYVLLEERILEFMNSNINHNFGVQFIFDLTDLIFY